MPKSKSVKTSTVKQFKDVPCPFCGLLCDDLSISRKNNQLTVIKNGCPKAEKLFAESSLGLEPRVQGEPVDLHSAIKSAAVILKRSKRPLLSGLGTDVIGMRAVMQLAEKTGAYLDHMHGNAINRNMQVIQDRGWMLTTLAEIKNRADLIIFTGTDAVSNYPRFFERFVWNQHTLTGMDPQQRQIVYIGDHLNTKTGISPGGNQPTVIKCPQENIAEVIATLRALLAGEEIRTKQVGKVKLRQLEHLVNLIRQSQYGAFVWAPGELDFPHAELTIRAVSELIKDLNEEQRFAGLSLGGNNGGNSALNVCAWQAGYPLRTSFVNGYPEYDPNKFSTENILSDGEADSILWISSFKSGISPPKTKLPSIVLADSDKDLDYEPDVFIPVGTAGLNHGGQMIRTDSVVSITMPTLHADTQISVHTVIEQIIEQL